VRYAIDTLGGLYELARLAVISRGRFRGAYWQWRLHTAFGRDHPPRAEIIRSIMDYARWVYRTRRGR
jgi:hypothetical protein